MARDPQARTAHTWVARAGGRTRITLTTRAARARTPWFAEQTRKTRGGVAGYWRVVEHSPFDASDELAKNRLILRRDFGGLLHKQGADRRFD